MSNENHESLDTPATGSNLGFPLQPGAAPEESPEEAETVEHELPDAPDPEATPKPRRRKAKKNAD